MVVLVISYKVRNKKYEISIDTSCTVKPVYNGHPWDSKKVSVVQRLRQSGCYSQFAPIKFLSVL